jgi:hypothetical protein
MAGESTTSRQTVTLTCTVCLGVVAAVTRTDHRSSIVLSTVLDFVAKPGRRAVSRVKDGVFVVIALNCRTK